MHRAGACFAQPIARRVRRLAWPETRRAMRDLPPTSTACQQLRKGGGVVSSGAVVKPKQRSPRSRDSSDPACYAGCCGPRELPGQVGGCRRVKAVEMASRLTSAD
jgi:hypothetical protein